MPMALETSWRAEGGRDFDASSSSYCVIPRQRFIQLFA
jgi:hypothetical protein